MNDDGGITNPRVLTQISTLPRRTSVGWCRLCLNSSSGSHIIFIQHRTSGICSFIELTPSALTAVCFHFLFSPQTIPGVGCHITFCPNGNKRHFCNGSPVSCTKPTITPFTSHESFQEMEAISKAKVIGFSQ